MGLSRLDIGPDGNGIFSFTGAERIRWEPAAFRQCAEASPALQIFLYLL